MRPAWNGISPRRYELRCRLLRHCRRRRRRRRRAWSRAGLTAAALERHGARGAPLCHHMQLLQHQHGQLRRPHQQRQRRSTVRARLFEKPAPTAHNALVWLLVAGAGVECGC